MENQSTEEKNMAKIFPEVSSEDSSIKMTQVTRTTTVISDDEPEGKISASEQNRSSATEVVDSPGQERELNMESLSIEEKNLAERFEVSEDSIIETVVSGDTPYSSASTFEDLKLSRELLKGLYVNMKFQKPSKIQAVSLPMILTPPYKHLVAQAHNGSGKTTCFVLGMLSRVDPSLSVPQALCICPTRELAIQNMGVLKEMGTYTGITAECAVPVPKEDANKKTFRLPVLSQIVIGTPGTVNKLISFKKLGTAGLKVLVFDEADQMLAQDGFQDDSLRIMKSIERSNSDYQVLLFSATFDEAVKTFVSKSKISNNCNELFVKKENLSLLAVKQYKVNCPDELSKILVIKDQILELGQKVGQTIVFVNSKRSASMLHEALVKFGYTVTTIHGALTHQDRDHIVKEFKEGLTQVLISTDLLARGFDQEQVNLIINFNMPSRPNTSSLPQYETYLHRIGRAGRFGRRGAVFNLLMSDEDRILVEKIEMYYGIQMTRVPSWNRKEDFEAALQEAGLLETP